MPFDFDGVQITEGVDFSILDDNKDDPRQFALKFRIALENEIGKAAPYDVDIEVAGVFSIISDMPAADREDFVRVNGCAVLYGAIRDQVLTLTSRSARGALMLPTVNFLDYRRNVKELVGK
ncbi:MAG: protein-export chaperone SecB [Gallionella sp.]|nr:protein-export chaperone SecB [Gallionella sp.]